MRAEGVSYLFPLLRLIFLLSPLLLPTPWRRLIIRAKVRPVSNDCLADLNVDVGDIVFFKQLSALEGHNDAIAARESSGLHADPEDDRGIMDERDVIRLGFPDADDIDGIPLRVHRVQKGVDLEG